MLSVIFKLDVILRWILVFTWFQSSVSLRSILINENNNFMPCTFKIDTLICNGNFIKNKPSLQFTTPSKTKIVKLKIVNLPIEELPENYLTPLAANLSFVKIHSSVKIKSINRNAFRGCSFVKTLEIKSQITKDKSPIYLTNSFHDLNMLADLKLVNLNILDLQLDYLENLMSLTFENCDLKTIPVETFRKNQQLSVLTIKGLKNPNALIDQFKNWPPNIESGIRSLSLENCNLRNVPKFSKDFSHNLTQLSLSENPIEKIDSDDTVNLKGLQRLSLSSTKLNHQFMGGLKRLENLKEIVLVNVTLKDLPAQIEQMTSLKSIYIERSQIEQLSVVLPSSIEDVEITNLREFVIISSHFLSKCDKLKVLNLNSLLTRDIKFLFDNISTFKHSLRVLSLNEYVLFKGELWKMIKPLTALENLYLNKAHIRSIPDDVLENLVSLKKLSLSHNFLTYESINTAGFQKVSQHLSHIDFSFNQLEHVPPCLFYWFSKLRNVNLLGNAIICDCNLRWLHERITKSSVVFPLLNFTCEAPKKNAGKAFYHLTDTDLASCSSNVDRCLPLKMGDYKISFHLSYHLEKSKIMIEIINASQLSFLFDYMKVNVVQRGENFHSDIDRYDMNQSVIEINQETQSDEVKVCLLLVRNFEEYEFPYNCQLLSQKEVSTRKFWMISIAISIGSVVIVIIIILGTRVLGRRLDRKKKRKSEEVYCNYQSDYSMPSDTYQKPDQYTEIVDTEEYYRTLTDSFMDTTFPFKDRQPKLYTSTQHLKRMSMPSKSVDEGLNINRTHQSKSKFRKSKVKGPSKDDDGRLADFASLNSLNRLEMGFPTVLNNGRRGSLPNTCVPRNLTALPEIVSTETCHTDCSPPKPKFPTSDIKNLLNNADNHLNYFLHYGSKDFVDTDFSDYSPYKVDSGLGVSRLSTHSQIRSTEDSSVII